MSVSTEMRRDFIGGPNVVTCRKRREYSEQKAGALKVISVFAGSIAGRKDRRLALCL